ncbi:MAG: ABC transporter ATP-binding protein [Bifidobacteriaceae bacterium]|jgi:putative ABC transport system ATP-binding protein|nr:ABC transporter ATP-binding protein [Bifidobacteriaceae bacterium]MCI1978596.1 ABC transporter ATP-binding protein [Bifidobacteriaceae bacterium]
MEAALETTKDISRPRLVELRDIGKQYGGTVPTTALAGVNLNISYGEFVAIVGESGSGKSTLLNIIGMLDTPTSGSYAFDGHPTETMTPSEIAYHRAADIGFIFQAFHLIPSRSALDNVAMAGMYNGIPLRTRQKHAEEALEKLGLAKKAAAFPQDLSGGEKQRVAIARAICNNPKLILCDEPTGNLDSQRSLSIMHIFDELHTEGMTLIMVTHNEKQTVFADRVVRTRDGILSEVEDSQV